jgi:multiple sugar transport system ATP-binding protein
MAKITLKNVSKVYPGEVTAVNDFSLEIMDKEFVVLVGPSGCGKSTTLRMIAGLEEISSGELYIGSRMVNDVAPKDRNIAMVFQNYALYPHMTVFKNMAFGLHLRHTPKEQIQQKVEETAKILGIEHLLDRKPKALSGGQRQRVALGRAMVRNPQVFLLDEPLSNLDAKLRTSMRSEISLLHKKLGTTFVYVTHDQTEAMTMGDRIVVMKDGLIQQVDTPQNLFDFPANLFVAGFIGTPQMNFLPATIDKREGKYVATVGGGAINIPESKAFDNEVDLLGEYVGKEAILGIRPEDIYCRGAEKANANTSAIRVHVDLVERMGSEKHVHATNGDAKLVARIGAHSAIADSDDVELLIDGDKLHIFDKKTELTILN